MIPTCLCAVIPSGISKPFAGFITDDLGVIFFSGNFANDLRPCAGCGVGSFFVGNGDLPITIGLAAGLAEVSVGFLLLELRIIKLCSTQLNHGVWGLGFGVWGLGFGVWGL